ncbi:MAG: hypothetical protein JRG96_13190 [Deltaproteobacteria bacterium]|nr:hypothetical protein [Deltaproteobacteria bacterium]MBW2417552.1 hypothetical protein [Deltaproteobacteria bacterium]
MMEGHELWIFGAAAVVVAAVVLAARWYEKKRTAALQDVAMRLGLSFLARDESIGTQPFASLPLFQRGESRRFRNVARGDELFVFGYSFTTGSGKNKSTYQQTVVALRVANVRLPAFQLSPEGFFDKIGTAFGGQDIDLDTDPEFSRRNRLRGEDEVAVKALFGQALRQHLAMDPGWSVEGAGEWLIIYRKRKRVAPDELATFVEQARRFAELIGRG